MEIKNDLKNQLIEKIAPFWLSQQDNINGGFYGQLDINLNSDKLAPKSGVMMSRFLWSFSRSYSVLKNKEYRVASDHAYNFLENYLWDNVHGGIYWLVTAQGEPINTIKHIYAQSFALYGLSEYSKINPDSDALEYAKKLFQLIEKKAYNSNTGGYEEEFDQTWTQKSLSQVSSKNPKVKYTTNTHLHLLEAYTNLYTVWPNEELLTKIQHLLSLFANHIFHPTGYCQQEFNENWESVTRGISYGHDIETAWLLDETLSCCPIENTLANDIHKITTSLADYCFKYGLDEKGWMLTHSDDQEGNHIKIWWVQAEAIIGLFNAFQKSGNTNYYKAVLTLSHLIQQYFVDHRSGSEWYSYINSKDSAQFSLQKHANENNNISDAWKGPYHTTRFYLEILKRLEEK